MKKPWVLTFSAIVALAGAAAGWAWSRSVHDPLFPLAEFPLDKYRQDYQSIVGKDFRCRWRYDAQLSGQEAAHMAVFTLAQDTWPITVLIPAGLIGTGELVPGKSFSMEVSVEQGGLIYAKLCRAY